MKSICKNEDAVSYGFFIIAVFLIGITAAWIMFMPTFNYIFISYNQNIADGMITTQNQESMQFHRNIIYIVPLIILLGIACWGIIRALAKRNET